jgi:hypothetical protein
MVGRAFNPTHHATTVNPRCGQCSESVSFGAFVQALRAEPLTGSSPAPRLDEGSPELDRCKLDGKAEVSDSIHESREVQHRRVGWDG